ncbi:MAG: RsmE family RNA methyltransferase [bacterium]|nr:RsmE family RNA methyltransferase [bacterium]
MRLHRFIGNFDLRRKEIVLSDKELVNQIKNTLRLKVGDRVILADGKLNEAVCEIEKIDKNLVEFSADKIYRNQNEPKRKVIFYCAVLKKENFEWVAQKATEVGVSEIQPIITSRTVKQKLNLERLQKIIREAAEQSGRGVVPILREPIDFKRAAQEAGRNESNLFFDISGKPALSVIASTINIFIGPEGGWEEKEIELAKDYEFKIISLGKLTLRAETAAVVSSYLTVNL